MDIRYQVEEKINSKGGKVNFDIFKSIDNISQLAFSAREISEFINKIFSI